MAKSYSHYSILFAYHLKEAYFFSFSFGLIQIQSIYSVSCFKSLGFLSIGWQSQIVNLWYHYFACTSIEYHLYLKFMKLGKKICHQSPYVSLSKYNNS